MRKPPDGRLAGPAIMTPGYGRVNYPGDSGASRGIQVPAPSAMGEDVLLGEAAEVECHAHGEDVEDGVGDRRTALAFQHGIEFLLDGVAMEHVVSRVKKLRLGKQIGRAHV